MTDTTVDRADGEGGMHVPDRARKGLGTLVGNAGEHFVMAELLRRECVGALAPRNAAPAFDILATRGGRTVRIRDRLPTDEAQEEERQWLFRIVESPVRWDRSSNERVHNAALEEIRRSCDGNPPPMPDPFCGGGSIPLEAQRLALGAHASAAKPVAVLITNAPIEIPPKSANRPPVHPDARGTRVQEGLWKGAAGLAEGMCGATASRCPIVPRSAPAG